MHGLRPDNRFFWRFAGLEKIKSVVMNQLTRQTGKETVGRL